MRPIFACLWLAACLFVPLDCGAAPTKPNIVVILADDLGYGDVHCYNPSRGKIATPHIDRFAASGMRFTDAHSSSGVCSPSRYTLLTGRYHWRTRLQAGIVGLWGAPLIAPERMTIASLAKEHGYRTACVGKWHLGWDWPIPKQQETLFKEKPAGEAVATDAHRQVWKQVFSQSIPGGPTSRGFDHYFGTDVPNWPPYCFIEDDRTVGVPSEFLPARLLRNNQASNQGPALKDWTLEPILPALGERAAKFITESASKNEPFLLYLPLTTPHTPLAVNQAWRGKSGLNDFADLVMETDAVVGQVLEALEKSGEADNTLVIFTSDNGCAPYIGVNDLEEKGHYPSGPLRGYKSDVWEGGHRIPLIVRWPAVVKPGTTSGQLAQQADFLATFAEILGAQLPPNAGEDSFSLLPLLKGEDKPVRTTAVNCASSGLPSVRLGSWKLILGPGSGGWSKGESDQPVQLYNLANDLAESQNLAAAQPQRVDELKALLEKIITEGRSRPGARQPNDVEVRRYPVATAAKRTAPEGDAGPAAAPKNPARKRQAAAAAASARPADGAEPAAAAAKKAPKTSKAVADETPPGKVFVYKHSGGMPREIEIYFPAGHAPASGKPKVPGLILFHGGGWSGGTLSQFRTACHYFASRGIVAATADYRMLSSAEARQLGEGETRKRVCITDAKSAIRWFKQHADELGIDPKRIITGGGSAGGHVSVLATSNHGLDDPQDPGAIDTSVAAYLLFNPAFALDDVKDSEVDVLRHIQPDLSSAIVFFGDQDLQWKAGWDRLHEKLQQQGNKTVELQIAQGQKHGFFNSDPWRTVTLIAADRFLARQGFLSGEPTLSAPATGEKLVAQNSPAASSRIDAQPKEQPSSTSPAQPDPARPDPARPDPARPDGRSTNRTPARSSRPNIVILYADDMGYGDLAVQNPQSKIPTPNLDRLASQGMRFTDAHSSSGVCTPSRYALLEGRYHWRKFHGIVNAFDQPILDDQLTTLPELLRSQGYKTACIGKWHLGWDWNAIKKPGAAPSELPAPRANARGRSVAFSPGSFDWSKPIPGGPLSHGFDYYFGDDVPNFPPYAWFENDRVITEPTVPLKTPEGPAEGSWEARPGPSVKDWDFWAVMPKLTDKAEAWIAKQKQDEPFFLYFPFTSPHAPIVPTKEFVGKSQANGFGDFVVQTDDTVGRVLAALEKHGFAEDTLVIFAADNGPEQYAYARLKDFDHRSAGPLRGVKRDLWEGGHRVPMIVRWPGMVPVGKVNEGLISQIDIYATIADILGAEIPAGSAEDSYSQLGLWRGQSPSARDIVVHNTNANGYALRHGDWVLIAAPSGAVTKVPEWFEPAAGYTPNTQPGELYNLREDLAQKHNLYAQRPDKVKELTGHLERVRAKGQVR